MSFFRLGRGMEYGGACLHDVHTLGINGKVGTYTGW